MHGYIWSLDVVSIRSFVHMVLIPVDVYRKSVIFSRTASNQIDDVCFLGVRGDLDLGDDTALMCLLLLSSLFLLIHYK